MLLLFFLIAKGRSYSINRLTKVERGSFSIAPHLDEVIIGLVLGGTYISKPSKVNARLEIFQGFVHEAYILHLYELLKTYCKSPPKYIGIKSNEKYNKLYTRIRFRTSCLPCFNYYHDLFYDNGIKRIPKNIGDLLTPISLAYWSMDEGYKGTSGFTLCTDPYTLSEVQLLIKV